MQEEIPSLIEQAQCFDRLDEEISGLEKTLGVLVGSDGREVIRTHLDWIESQCERLAGEFGGDWRGVWEMVREEAGVRRVGVSLEALVACLPSSFREAVVAAGESVGEARQRWEEFKRLDETIRGCRQSMESTLRAFECEDVRELENRLVVAQTQLGVEIGAMEKLAEEHPSLPRPRADGVYDDIDARYAGLQEEAKGLEEELRQSEARLAELTLRQAELHGGAPVNIAEAELRLDSLKQQADRLKLELEAVTLAHRELSAAATEYYDSHLGRLQERAGGYFSTVSKSPGRRVHLDDELKVMAVQGDGKRLVPAQLSQGARDQLYLSLRLAICDLLSDGRNAPLILDDPFHNCDEERLDAIRQALLEFSRDRQVLLFTHRPDFAGWGEAITLTRGGGWGRGA